MGRGGRGGELIHKTLWELIHKTGLHVAIKKSILLDKE